MMTPQAAGLSQFQRPNRLAGFKDGQITVSTQQETPWLLYVGIALLAYYFFKKGQQAARKRARVAG